MRGPKRRGSARAWRATGGAIAQWDYLNPDFPMDLAKATLAEAKADQKYW